MGILRRIGFGIALLPGVVWGAPTFRAIGPTLYVNESPVLTLKLGVGRESPGGRVAKIAASLRQAKAWTPVATSRVESDIVLAAGGTPVVRITQAEAKAWDKPLPTLASNWSKALKEALELPPLRVESRVLRVGIGADAFVTLTGSAAATAQVESGNVAVFSAAKAPLGIRLKGLKRGSSKIVIRSEGATLSVPVEVVPLAASFPQSTTATVIGDPATAEAIAGAIEASAQRTLKTAPHAQVEVLSVSTDAIGMGATVTVQARVRVSAPNMFPSEGIVQARVTNLSLALRRESELWYCNYPENVVSTGNLFAADLREGSPARMLYHHINQTRRPLVIQVLAKNPYDTPVKVAVIPGDGRPHTDPVRVGLDAGERFVRGYLTGSGEVITIPAGKTIPIAMRRLAPGETMSGLCYLRLLPGGPTRIPVRTDAVEVDSIDKSWLAAARTERPWSRAQARDLRSNELNPLESSPYIFPEPFKEIDSTFQVGGRFQFIRVGQKPITTADDLKRLDGNFGVIYTVRTRIENPTEKPTQVEVVFEASAGYSGALFVVNGQYQRAPLLMSKAEYIVRKVTLAPGAAQDLTIMTIPLSGSSYPATITVRPTGAF